jgi:hypothetical protein
MRYENRKLDRKNSVRLIYAIWILRYNGFFVAVSNLGTAGSPEPFCF